MKNIFHAVLLSAVVATSSFAQHHTSNCWPVVTTGSANHYNGDQVRAARTTASSGRRLIGASAYSYNTTGGVYVLEDTISLDYPGGRGSSFSFFGGWEMKYDTLTNYAYGTWQPYVRTIQTFDAADNLSSSIDVDWVPWLSIWRDNRKTEYMYDASGNKLSTRMYQWDTVSLSWSNYGIIYYSYNVANLLTHELFLGWNTATSSWDSSYQTNTSYNSANQKTEQLTLSALTTPGAWENSAKTTYTYDAGGNCITELQFIWNTTTLSWDGYSEHERTFDVAHNMLSDTTFLFDATGLRYGKELWTYDAFVGPSPTTTVRARWDAPTTSFYNTYQTNLVYGSDGQPDYYFTRTWDGATSGWIIGSYDLAEHFYYEAYTLRADLRNTAEPAILLSPIPVSNHLNIALQWAQPQPFTIQVCDVLGKVQYNETVPGCGSFTGSIPVDALPAGSYVVKFTGPLQQCKRLVTVSH